MKVHFCDLCNESVPQSDLDEGRAFLRKGRVICASCDRSMSNEPETPGGPFDKAAGPVAAGVVVAGAAATGTGRAATTSLPGHRPTSTGVTPAFGAAPYQPAMSPRARGGSGTGIALMALLFTGGLAFWASGRIGSLESELTNRTQQLEDKQYDASLRFDQALERSSDGVQDLGSGLRDEVREMRDWLNAELSEGQLQAREVRSRIDAFGERVDTMSESFGNVNRHDQELIHLQQRYTALAEELGVVSAQLEQLATTGVVVKAPEEVTPVPEETPPAPPPWMGLVEQLASPNTSERWQAVVALGETRDPAVSEFLVPALVDEDIFIRMVTARVLGDLGSPVGIPALIDALDDDESAVREAAYIALKAVSKRELPFDPVTEDASDRARRIKAWRDWWEKEKDRFLEG